MVWKDFEAEDTKESGYLQKLRQSARLAHPTDRSASCLVDISISLSISSLLAAPIHKNIQEALMIGESSKFVLYAFVAAIIHVLFYVFFVAYFISKYEQSLGQKVFGVRVVHIWTGKPLSFTSAFLRSLTWVLELTLLFPLAAVYTDSYRRVLHERISDSISLATQERFSRAPREQEKSFMKGLLLPAYLWVFAVFLSLVSNLSNEFLKEETWLAKLDKAIPYCEQVVDASVDWPIEKGQEKESRLMVALGMYSANLISKDCLKAEADAAFLRKKELDYAYLAKSFSTETKTELSDEYLIKVCEDGKTNSDACLFSKLIRYWANDEKHQANRILQTLIPTSHSFVKNWAIKYYLKNKNYLEAYRWIEYQSKNRHLASFVANYRTRALWALGRKAESIVSFQASRASLDPVEERRANAWMCWSLSKASCGELEQSICKGIEEWQPVEEFFQTEEVLAIVNHSECFTKKSRVEIADNRMSKSGVHERAFLKAYSGLENNMFEVLVHGMAGNMESDLRSEVFRRLVKEQQDLKMLKNLEHVLMLVDSSNLNWEEDALELISAYYRLDFRSDAIALKNRILNSGDISEFSKQELVGLSEHFDKKKIPSLKSQRLPASILVPLSDKNSQENIQ